MINILNYDILQYYSSSGMKCFFALAVPTAVSADLVLLRFGPRLLRFGPRYALVLAATLWSTSVAVFGSAFGCLNDASSMIWGRVSMQKKSHCCV